MAANIVLNDGSIHRHAGPQPLVCLDNGWARVVRGRQACLVSCPLILP